MPIYEFKCKSCGEIFESFVIKSHENVSCPKCGSVDLEKLISATNISSSLNSGIQSSCGSSSSGFS